jgi:acyl carrier protein
MEKDTTQRVIDIIAEEVGSVDAFSTFDDLHMDSLDLLDLLLRIENVEGVKFPPDLISDMNTVGDIARAADALRV